MSKVTLPADDAFLEDELMQWWYWTGHLATESGRNFGFELCFFAVDAGAMSVFETISRVIHDSANVTDFMSVQMMNAAFTDIDNHKFFSRVDYKPGPPKEITDGFHLKNIFGDCIATGGNGQDKLESSVDSISLAIELCEQTPPTIHYNGDKHKYDFGGSTYYYSRGKLTGEGTLEVDGKTEKVTASVWFDRQYGELAQACFLVGWQWFAIQLDDNTQIMLFAYHNEAEHMGSITLPSGETSTLSDKDFQVEIMEWWLSPHTGRKYPSKWRLNITGGYALEVVPKVADQELDESWMFPKYWEGACSVGGSHPGSAYVELVGYPRHKWL